MKKLVTSVVAAVALSATSAFAADMPVKGAKAPVIAPAPSPFDIAFGGVIMSDYNFRGVSQSNNGPSVGAYVEPQLITGFGTLYVGLAGYAIEWPSGPGYFFSDPTAEIDFYGGWRHSWGPISVDLGLLYYYYPGEQFGVDSDFLEIYAKAAWAVTPAFTLGANVFYTPDLLNYGQFGLGDTPGVYVSGTAKWVLPWTAGDIGAFVSGELGHWFLEEGGVFGPGIDASYTYWNIGAALTYKVFTLDFRYHGTDMNATECTTFLFVGPANGANKWCDDAFIVSLKFDTTLAALK
jgi:uncharacterized protein (TIGR02001 family)